MDRSMKSFQVRTDSRTELIDVTARVRSLVEESGVTEGVVTVYVPHTTAGVTINEAADPSVKRDILNELNTIVPFDDGYTHAEGNSAAHIKTTLVGSSVTVPVASGSPALGTWQGIYFCEFDGPRSRHVHCTVLGS